MNTFSEVIDAFKGRFAESLGIEDSHARTMKARDSIPSTRWAATVSGAERMQVEGVTLELLARLEADKAQARVQESVQ